MLNRGGGAGKIEGGPGGVKTANYADLMHNFPKMRYFLNK